MLLSLKVFVFALAVVPLVAQVPSDVPVKYQSIYTDMSTQISAFQTTLNQSWNGAPYAVNWAPHLSSAESLEYLTLLGNTYYTATVLPELLEIQATGAKAVTVHIDFPVLYQPFYTYENAPANYEKFVAFYQQLISDVHARGMKLVVEATVSEALDGTDGADFAPYYLTLEWTAYMAARAQHDVNVAQLIKPDYLSLICEPDSESFNGSQPTEDSPAGALQLLDTILAAFQQADVSGVTIGAGAGTWIANFTEYMTEFAAAPLNYVDMHVYPVNQGYLSNVIAGAAIIHQAKKPMGISEAWPDKLSNSELSTSLGINIIDARDVFSFWAPIDTAFLQAMVDCAQYEEFLFFSPSYPEYFAAYLNYNLVAGEGAAELLPAAFAASATANRAGQFTTTGTAFSKMIVGTDKTPPTTPTGLTGSPGTTSVTLSWTPSTDNIGVAGYNIYRDQAIVGHAAVSPYYDSGIPTGVTYTYNISAFDAQGNVSGQSAPLVVETIDLSPPSVPTNLKMTSDTTSSVSLSWSPSTGGGGVGGYRLLRGTSASALSVIAGYVLGTTYTDPYTRASTTYYYAVESYNETGITSAASAAIKVTTP